MNTMQPVVWLCVLNLAFIAALPRVFFRPGHLNRSWWLTAAPFMITGAGLLAGPAALLPSGISATLPNPALPNTAVPYAALPYAALLSAALPYLATALAAASIALIGLTLGSHREPVSLWHQERDTPNRIVRHGAYARIRHPFYAAFLLALCGCMLAVPGPLTVTGVVFAALQLRRTAVREERRLLRSPLGAEYGEYMTATGRFLPRLRYSAGSLPERT